MEENEIDKMFNAFNCENYEELLQLAGMDVTVENVSKLKRNERESIELLYKNLMKRIENGDVEYFLSNVLSIYIDICIKLLEYSTDISTSNRLKKIIEKDREKIVKMYPYAYTYVTVRLIIATNDPDYIKSIVESKEKIKELNLSNEYIVDLIIATNDSDYMKSMVDSKERREELELTTIQIIELIVEASDSGYIKSIIDSKERREELEFTNEDIVDLIIETNDSGYIKSIIESKERREELQFTNEDIVELIIGTNDSDYIKEIIDNKEKRKEIDLYRMDIVKLIINANDFDYIKSIVDSKEKREKLELTTIQIYELILRVNIKDPNYIKSIIDSEKRWKELGLDRLDNRKILSLIKIMNNCDYIKEIIDSKEKRKQLKLNGFDVFQLILGTRDSNYIKSIIDSKEKREELNINDEDIVHLIIATNDSDYMKKYLDEIGNEDITVDYRGKIVLPEYMTIGIEIESEGENSVILRNLSGFIEKGWEHKNDGSLSNGIEIVSPILTGDNEKTSKSIKNVCTYLNKLRTDCIRKMWGTYSYRCRLLNYTKELDEFNRNMGKYRKNIIYNKQ